MSEPADVLVVGDWVLTMDAERTMVRDGALAVRDGRIADVGPAGDVTERWETATVIGGRDRIVLPGLINAHQHLTGDRLARSTIPDDIDSVTAIFAWAVPLHLAAGAGDEHASATAALVDAVTHGITFTVEAGTVAHPATVLAAYDRVGVGGTLGTWGSDAAGLPLSGDVDEVIGRLDEVLRLTAGHERVRGWVTLVGHDLMSDDLAVAASTLAQQRATNLTFHLSPTDADPAAYLARTDRRPVVHLAELGVLGPHVLIAHAVHVDDDELDTLLATDTAVACCPWAYLRLGQGVTTAGRHAGLLARGGRLALGCDAENAGDAVDVLRAAALAAGLARDGAGDAYGFGAHVALELSTIRGAEAIGMADEIGSLEIGKRADVVVIDTSGPAWQPPSPDPVLGLVWGGGGSSVSDVVCAGRVVVADGQCVTVDDAELRREVELARTRVLGAAALDPHPRWPVSG